MRRLLNLPTPRTVEDIPAQPPEPQICNVHNVEMIEKGEVIMVCPEEGCGQFEIQQDLQSIPLWSYNCQECNWCYPTPVEDRCVICNQDVAEQLEQLINNVRN